MSMGKIQVVLHPALPATCCVCNRSANGIVRFMDFQKDLDYYGAVVICEDCAKEMLDVLEFVPVARLQEELNANVVLMEKIRKLEDENERVRGALDSVLLVRPDLRDDDVDDSEDAEQTVGSGTLAN